MSHTFLYQRRKPNMREASVRSCPTQTKVELQLSVVLQTPATMDLRATTSANQLHGIEPYQACFTSPIFYFQR
jgi:hypothetical protein